MSLLIVKVMPERSIVLLHACAHNPTGVDPKVRQIQLYQCQMMLVNDTTMIQCVSAFDTPSIAVSEQCNYIIINYSLNIGKKFRKWLRLVDYLCTFIFDYF